MLLDDVFAKLAGAGWHFSLNSLESMGISKRNMRRGKIISRENTLSDLLRHLLLLKSGYVFSENFRNTAIMSKELWIETDSNEHRNN